MGNNNAKVASKPGQVIKTARQPKMVQLNMNIATLKIGQSYSPLEFYPDSFSDQVVQHQGSNFDKKLNDIFIIISKRYETEDIRFKKDEQAKLKYLNKMTKKRFTPLFHSQIEQQVAGVKEKVYLMTYRQFSKKWDISFETVLEMAKKEEIKNRKNTKLSPFQAMQSTTLIKLQTDRPKMKSSYSLLDQIEEQFFEQKYQRKLKILDLMSYHALLAYIYEDIQSSIDQLATNNYNFKYKCFMKNLYASERNSLMKRMKCVINYAKQKNISILFLQEVTENGLSMLTKLSDEYRISKTHFKKTGNRSAIMIRKDIFNLLEPERTHWTLGALNARYLQNFQWTGNQIPSPVKRNPQNQIEMMKATYRLKESQVIGRMFDSKSRKFEDNSASKVYVNEEEMQIDSIQNRKVKEQIQTIESAQKYSMRKKLQPISGLGLIDHTLYQKPLPKIPTSSLRRQSKQEIFENNMNRIGENFLQNLKYPQNTVVQFVGNLILISAQIEQQNILIKQRNIEDVLKMVCEFKQKFPRHTIIMGLDIDSDLQIDRSVKVYNNVETLLGKGFHTIPSLPVLHKNQNPTKGMVMNYFQAANTFTINYTKTNFQFDRKNVEQKVIGCNNFVISTLDISEGTIQTSKGVKLKFDDNLPNKDHPFINYFVRGRIYHRNITSEQQN